MYTSKCCHSVLSVDRYAPQRPLCTNELRVLKELLEKALANTAYMLYLDGKLINEPNE